MFSITRYLEYVLEWKSKGLSSERFKAISTSDNSLNLTLSYYGTKIKVKFTGDCLKQQKITYSHRKVVKIYIVYKLGTSSSNNSDSTIKNCLFGAVTLTKNVGILVTEVDLIEEKVYSINFTVTNIKFCLSLHYNGANSCLLMVKQKILKL